MPRPDPYTPRRRLLMKLIMWLVFAGTMGLAALVVHQQERARRVELAAKGIESSGVWVRLPADWKVRPPDGADPRVIAEASEPRSGRSSRSLTVYQETLAAPMSALEYLASRFDVMARELGDERATSVTITRATQFGQYPGVISSRLMMVPGNAEDLRFRLTYAAAVLPSGRAVAIKVEGRGSADRADAALVDQVARHITISDEPVLGAPDERVALAGGIEVTAVRPFRAVQARDPNRTSRRLWYSSEPEPHRSDPWASVELIPCVFPSAEMMAKNETDGPTELRTMLLTRDPRRWRGARVKPLADGHFQVDVPEQAAGAAGGELLPTRAYLQASPTGHALLAIVRAPAEDLAAYWNQIRSTIKFSGSLEPPELARAGAAEAMRLRELPLEQVLAEREDQWHLWVNQTEQPQVGWSRVEWTRGAVAADMELRRRSPDGALVKVTQKWNASSDWNRYRCDATSVDARPDALPRTTAQRIDVRGDSVSFSTSVNEKNIEHWKRTAPAAYLPGALLEHVIGKLSPTPMILKTDSFLRHETVGAEGFLTLIVREIPAASSAPAGRTIAVEVNGSGEISVWRFKPDGTLQSVAFANGLKRIDANEKDIRREFARDPGLTP